ncbi:hypothetical protein FKM82_016094 [Ascaphus truei]
MHNNTLASDPGEDDLGAQGWEPGKLINEPIEFCGSLEDDLNKPQTSDPKSSYLDVEKEMDSKQELIDDREFDIPQVDTPPTLESILNEVSLPQMSTEQTLYKRPERCPAEGTERGGLQLTGRDMYLECTG